MIKVTPFINTVGTEKFREFLTQPFDFDLLLTLFDGWKSYKTKYTNGDNIEFDVYSDFYILRNDDVYIRLSYPPTLNEFIDTLIAFNIQLYWKDHIDENFDPKDYLHKDEVKGYYASLLDKMNKSHELL